MAWLLPLGLTLMEVEQWKWDILAFCQSKFPGMAVGSLAHFWVMGFAGVLMFWLWARAAMCARSVRRAAFGILPFAAIGVLEAIFHAGGVVYFREYVPGTVMALTVFGPASLLLVRHAWRDGLVPHAYVIALAVFVLLDVGYWLIGTEIHLARKLEAGERFGAALARLVGQ